MRSEEARTCPVSVDTKNNPSSSWLWDLWETRRVFQVSAVNAKRFPQTRQIPQPSESCCDRPFEESGFGLHRADAAVCRMPPLAVVEHFDVIKQSVMCRLA